MKNENWVLNSAWKNRQSAKNAAIKNTKKVRLIPHPKLAKTWIEVEIPEEEERDAAKYGLEKSEETVGTIDTIDGILKEVSEYSRISVDEICKKSRKRTIVESRQVAHFMAKSRTSESLVGIADKIGQMNHATIIHSCKTVKNLFETSPEYRTRWMGLIG
jgi:chromosomal replication initiation ATPase DnaA